MTVRNMLVTAVSLTALLCVTAQAEAKRYRDTSTLAERERADAVDPGNRFGTYPAWARIAFAGGGGRR